MFVDRDALNIITGTRRMLPSTTASRSVLAALAAFSASPGHAQATPNLVGACSGVSLPRSAVTGIVAPIVNGIVAPTESRVNGILGVLGALPGVPSNLSIDTTGLLATAAAGQPITLQAVNANGVLVGPGDRCDLRSDSYGLDTEGGIAIGGNAITGLGTGGLDASAGEGSSIALGNSALTGAGATGAVAIGTGAQALAANSVALGRGSVATRGALASYAALGLAAPQSSAGTVSIGTAGGERQITDVAAGSAPTDAVNVAQLAGVAASVGTLSDSAVQYDGVTHGTVTLDGLGGTRVTNVAPGALSATSSDTVNGSQLFATNAAVTTTADAVANLTLNVRNGGIGPVRYANPGTPTIPNGGLPTNDLTLVGAVPAAVGLHNVRAGVVAAGSTDAVNGGQLYALGYDVAALNGLAVQYDDATQARVTLGGAGAPPVAVGNVAAGSLAAGSTDAVNGGQLGGLGTGVAAALGGGTTYDPATNALATDLTYEGRHYASVQATFDAVAAAAGNGGGGGTPGPLRYSDLATPTTPNGGTPTNDATLVGGTDAPVALHNVAGGAVAAGSTDAVNGGQLYVTNQAVTAAQSTADGALALGRNSVQYDGGSRTDVTLGDAGTPVALHNVAPGTAPTDAVNVAQLGAGIGSAVTQSDAYTDTRIAALHFDLRHVERDANAGTAGALAAAGLPQAYTAGKGMIAMAMGAYEGQTAFALGMSKAMNDGHTVVKLGGTYDTRSRAGASAGVGYQF